MISSLVIKNFILIEGLNLSFGHKTTVLTGETGAGKSILLDAVSFVLGAKADASLVMKGAEAASVAATFEVGAGHPALGVLAENGFAAENGEIIVRRVLGADGKGKAFVNDAPVSLGVLKSLGEHLVEIHGQFDNQSLLNPATHLAILDEYGGNRALVSRVRAAFSAWRELEKEAARLEDEFAAAKRDEDYLRYNHDELKSVAPVAGEEAELDLKRRSLMSSEKAATAVSDACGKLMRYGGVPEGFINDAIAQLARVSDLPGVKEAAAQLEVASAALGDAFERLSQMSAGGGGTATLEAVEERLFKIRELARKHRCQPDELAALLQTMAVRLESIDNSDEVLKVKRAEAEAAKASYMKVAGELSVARRAQAAELSARVMAELPPLKLEKATVEVRVSEAAASASGVDSAVFVGAANYGQEPGPLHKTASGGELARLVLAIKVVLLSSAPSLTMIFDEVDTGISGATAAAVGERLALLGSKMQTLVVTHSPQVASFGDHHLKVSKSFSEEKGRTITEVAQLDERCRVLEIARIISGDKITDEAVMAAEKLLKH
ncbi:MAG: DNA repair protein RecN [Rickettsiales bacterium]|nr:DNA repair protein RecN [Rickettsiales bacterium]